MVETGNKLPLRQVVLFSSGVAYFERVGRMEGAGECRITVRRHQMPDLVKSLVLLDPGGRVEGVTTQGAIPPEEQMRLPALRLDENQSLAALLEALHGAEVRLQRGNGGEITGRILTVDRREAWLPGERDRVTEEEWLVLLTPSGIEQVPLREIGAIRPVSEELFAELQSGLALLGDNLNDLFRTVTIRFGQGEERQVRAGYLLDSPSWRISYRLVLEESSDPLLQGWGIFENATDEDWCEVGLSLVSGQPISFIQDLFRPVYVDRPVVGPPVPRPPRPGIYEGAVSRPHDGMPMMLSEMAVDACARFSADEMDQVPAAGTELQGELFHYRLTEPVTARRGQLAMAPILSDRIKGERLALFDPESDEERLLSAFLLRNSTSHHLAPGPVTLFSEGSYAGDARLSHTAPGEERLLTYGVQADIKVDYRPPVERTEIVSMTIVRGVLRLEQRHRLRHVYKFRNSGSRAHRVMVQQAKRRPYQPVDPSLIAEETAGHLRYRIDLGPGKSSSLDVVMERIVRSEVVLLDEPLERLLRRAESAPEPVGKLLQKLIQARRSGVEMERQLRALEEEQERIKADQARIRQNLAKLQTGSPLHTRYIDELTRQEDRLAEIRTEETALRIKIDREQARLEQEIEKAEAAG